MDRRAFRSNSCNSKNPAPPPSPSAASAAVYRTSSAPVGDSKDNVGERKALLPRRPEGGTARKAYKGPILGALTVEDIKISSANSSPSPSPDDMPILGTVGAYWNCSGAKGGGHDDSVTRGGFMKTRSRFGQNLA
ncbi:uncharacterized protein LOC119323541 [Triticum dicoccoides]|uniref:uncharacterized protein LOC119323541 n=1 Tax=Triticum dicoccoides TaxID=85692 RepID=UPI001891896C|nr:uncharacterized protein LOC119323541 [Triticum dicoccoides]XP_037453122.1 uncharacterized protein LOC119323541 [Triticum dicoccoides]